VDWGSSTPIHPTKKMITAGWLYGILSGLGFYDANPPYSVGLQPTIFVGQVIVLAEYAHPPPCIFAGFSLTSKA